MGLEMNCLTVVSIITIIDLSRVHLQFSTYPQKPLFGDVGQLIPNYVKITVHATIG